jgi:hypothetical protein
MPVANKMVQAKPPGRVCFNLYSEEETRVILPKAIASFLMESEKMRKDSFVYTVGSYMRCVWERRRPEEEVIHIISARKATADETSVYEDQFRR